MTKIYKWLMVAMVALTVFAGCAASSEESTATTEVNATEETPKGTDATVVEETPAGIDAATETLQLTLEELTAYNGEGGMPAYVAVDGVIYDVTGAHDWRNGAHNGVFAGNDLTEEINKMSPHGLSVLDELTVVGELIN